MLDKLNALDDFCDKMNNSFATMFNIIGNSRRNIILININTPYIQSLIGDILKGYNYNVEILSYFSISKHDSIGAFLRNKLDCTRNGILLLDFFSNFSAEESDLINIANDINTNRDFFTKKYNSVVLLTPPNLTFVLKSYAVDITSCMDLYIDTTKWYCSPYVLPLIKIRNRVDYGHQILTSFKDHADIYEEYIDIKNEIGKILFYTPSVYKNIIKRVKNFYTGIYYFDLIIRFIKKFTNISSKPQFCEQRIKDLKLLAVEIEDDIMLMDAKLMLAEFFYRSCEYDEAIACYRSVLQTVNEKLISPQQDKILCFLQCNIVVCTYLKNGIHEPSELLHELKIRLGQIDINSSNDIDFFETYLFLINITCKHHNYIQHQEILYKLQKMKFTNSTIYDLSDDYNRILSWENFICCPFKLSFRFLPADSEEIYSMLQNMILEFCTGNYSEGNRLYKKINYIATCHSDMQIKHFIEKYKNNIHFLCKKMKKTFKKQNDILFKGQSTK